MTETTLKIVRWRGHLRNQMYEQLIRMRPIEWDRVPARLHLFTFVGDQVEGRLRLSMQFHRGVQWIA